MQIQQYTDINKIKDIWQRIYCASDLSFFQSFEWNAALVKSFNKQRLTRPMSLRNKKIIFYLLDNCVIIPALIDKKNQELFFLGEDKPSDYLSFIYNVKDSLVMEQYITLF